MAALELFGKPGAEYVEHGALVDRWDWRSVGYRFGSEFRSAKVGKTWAKLAFDKPRIIEAVMEDVRRLPKPFNPSSWASFFHKTLEEPEMPSLSYQAACPRFVYGGWQEHVGDTRIKQGDRQYDIVSAYAWAGMSGPLPDWGKARPTHGEAPKAGQLGLWFGTWKPSGKVEQLPAVLRHCEEDACWVSSEDMESLGLSPIRTVRGLVFEGRTSRVARHLEKMPKLFPDHHKKIFRAWWGIYACDGGLVESRPGKEDRKIRNPFRNAALAHFITGRVRSRLAAVRGVKMYYVDAVVTSERLKTSAKAGGWKQVPIGDAAKMLGFYEEAV